MTEAHKMTASEMDARSAMNLAGTAAAEDDGSQETADYGESLAASWASAAALTRIASAMEAHVLPRGCVCPAGAEFWCRGPMCPHREAMP